jgi:hypothetical protein
MLGQEAAAWEEQRNQASVRIHWRFGIQKARTKLRRLYPEVPDSIKGTVY